MGERYDWHQCDRTELFRLLPYLEAGRLLLAVHDGEACRATVLRGREELAAALADYAARFHPGPAGASRWAGTCTAAPGSWR